MKKRGVKPNRATWFVWALVNIIVAVGYVESGADDSKWTMICYAIGGSVIFIASIFRGEGGWKAIDVTCLVLAIPGAVVLWKTELPELGLSMGLLVSGIGTVPTWSRLRRGGGRESNWAYGAWFSGNLVNLMAVHLAREWGDLAISLPPFFFIAQTASILLLNQMRKP